MRGVSVGVNGSAHCSKLPLDKRLNSERAKPATASLRAFLSDTSLLFCLESVFCGPRWTLVERGGPIEHGGHISDTTSAPSLHGLVERGGATEHAAHVSDTTSAPSLHGLVERGGVTEHEAHISDTTLAATLFRTSVLSPVMFGW